MKRSTSLALAVAIGLAGLGLGGGTASAAPAPAAPVLRVMPLGDSITAGVGSETGAGYRRPLYDLLAAQSRYTVDFVGSGTFGNVADPDNEGHSGALIDEISPSVDTWTAAAQPDVVLLHLGINDLARGEREHAPDRLSALIDRITAARPGATVLVQGLIPTTPGLEDAVAAYNTKVQEFVPAKQRNGQKVRYLAPPSLSPAAELPDGLHPNDRGYAKMAQVYAAGLDQAVGDGLAVRPAAKRAGTESGGTGRVRFADFDGDGRADYLVLNDNGSVRVLLNRGGDGHGGWQDLGQVAVGTTTDRSRVRFADFDGDGRADYLTIADNGSVGAYLNRGGDGHGGWQDLGRVAVGTTTVPDQVRFADFDGDGRADYLTIADSGAVCAFLNRGGDGRGGWQDQHQVAAGLVFDRSRLRLADFDGDGRADYTAVNPDGSVTSVANRGGDGHGGWQDLGRIASGLTTDQRQVEFADFDGDSHADYLLTDRATSAYAYNGGDGHGGWTDLGRIATGV